MFLLKLNRKNFYKYLTVIKYDRTDNTKLCFQQRLFCSKKPFDDSDEKMEKIRNEITNFQDKKLYPEYQQKELGIIYDKKPFKYECIKGKAYVWCSCGHSHKQVNF